MKIKTDLLTFRLSLWITAELYLGYIGLDNLADYSEYLLERNASQIIASGQSRLSSWKYQ